jgi:integrase
MKCEDGVRFQVLTEKAIVAKAKKPGIHADGAGLYLLVGRRSVAGHIGACSWVFRYMRDRRAHAMGLGRYPDVSLQKARQRAGAAREQLAAGRDPIAGRNAERTKVALEAAKAITFQVAAEQYIAAHKAGWRNAKHAEQWTATLTTYAYPVFGALPVGSIDTELVMKALDPIWAKKPETATRVRGRIEAILDLARVRGYRDGENPARWGGHLDKLLPRRAKVARVKHHAALPYGDLPAFLGVLRAQDGTAARALEFAILTGARTGEVIGATWGEINLAERLWRVPADRMKAGKEHRVPLSTIPIVILGAMLKAAGNGEPDAYVFPGAKRGQPLSNMAMTMALRRMGRGDLTTHGFRSTFRDWAAERTGFPAEVAEMALAHAVSDKVEAAYRRGNLFQKRRQLADAWAKYCGTAPAHEMGRIVVAIRSPTQ